MSDIRLYRVMRDLEGKHCGNEYLGNLVTCGECKHWIGETEHYEDREYKACWQLCGQYMDSEFWCKYGIRKGDENVETD